jgi:hypothetical protein
MTRRIRRGEPFFIDCKTLTILNLFWYESHKEPRLSTQGAPCPYLDFAVLPEYTLISL